MLYKPKGFLSANRDKNYPTAMDLISDRDGMHICGRLDKDAEGLLIITDDGDLTFRLTNPAFGICKKYYFEAFGKIDDEKIKSARDGGIPLGDKTPSKPAFISNLKLSVVEEHKKDLPLKNREKYLKNPDGIVSSGIIEVSEGKFHEVKLILYHLGCKIYRLKRISIGEICLDNNLLPGEYRYFNDAEISWCEKTKKLWKKL